MARQLMGLKVSNILSTHPERFVFCYSFKVLFSFDTIFNIALIRRTRQRSDLLGDISKFKEEYLKMGKLIEVGWKEVPWVDGSGLKSWHQLRAKLVEEGRESIVGGNGWPKLPLEIRNEEIVGIKKDFCREVESLADLKLKVLLIICQLIMVNHAYMLRYQLMNVCMAQSAGHLT